MSDILKDEDFIRMADVTFPDSKNYSNKEYTFLCPDKSISGGDEVYCEGSSNIGVVVRIYSKPTRLCHTKDLHLKTAYSLDPNSKYPRPAVKKDPAFTVNYTRTGLDCSIDTTTSEQKTVTSSKNEDDKVVKTTPPTTPIKEEIKVEVKAEEESPKEDNPVIEDNDIIDDGINPIDLLKISVEVKPNFSYIDYHADAFIKIKEKDAEQTDFSFISNIQLTNESVKDINNISIKFNFSSEIFNINPIKVEKIEAESFIVYHIPFLEVKKTLLEDINNITPASLTIEIVNNNTNEILKSTNYPFTILPIDQPSEMIITDKRLFAKYVDPQSTLVKQLTLDAKDYLETNRPFIAYQNTGDNRYNIMLTEVKAIYNALHSKNIAYLSAHKDIGFFTQKLRLPDVVLNDKIGTCIELALLFCSCLEAVGYNSILVLIDGHAFAGVYLEDASCEFPNGIETNVGIIYNKATNPNSPLILIECTDFTSEYAIPFRIALSDGIERIKMYKGQTFAALDISQLHKGQIFSPIPSKGIDLELKGQYAEEIKDDYINKIIKTDYIDVRKENNNNDRFTLWKRKLLDLNEKNVLINFKMTPLRCIKLTANIPVYKLIENNALKNEITLRPLCPKDTVNASTIIDCFYDGNSTPNSIFGSTNDNEFLGIGFEKTLKKIIKNSNSAQEETGAPTLYLSLGVLTYKNKKKKTNIAPFIVMPVKIIKDKMGINYTIHYDYEDMMINQTFFEYYKQDHKDVNFDALYSVSSQDGYQNIVQTFLEHSGADIQLEPNIALIANLTFSHYIMWKDMEDRKEQLNNNKIVKSIINNASLLKKEDNLKYQPIDEIEDYREFAAPLNYDSTQLRAIINCGAGKSFILDGPPGTGKSQTIVNMIVNAIYHDKTVLFIAEKKAALDVVADRLRKLGDPNSEYNLGRFCLELHSNKANKSNFFEKLRKSQEIGQTKEPEFFNENCEKLIEQRDYLANLLNKTHEHKYFYSLYESITTKLEYESINVNEKSLSRDLLTSINHDKATHIHEIIEQFVVMAKQIDNFDQSPIKYISVESLNNEDINHLQYDFQVLKSKFKELYSIYKTIFKENNIDMVFDINDAKAIITVLNICFNKEIYVSRLAEFLNTNIDVINEIFTKSEKFLKDRNDLRKIFNLDLVDNFDSNFALTELNTNNGFFKDFMNKRKYSKELKALTVNKFKFKTKDVIKLVTLINNYKELLTDLTTISKDINYLLNINYFANIDQYSTIRQKFNNTIEFINKIKLLKNGEFINNLSTFSKIILENNITNKIRFNDFYHKYNDYLMINTPTLDKYGVNYQYIINSENSLNVYEELLNIVSDSTNYKNIRNLSILNKYKNELINNGLSSVINQLYLNKFSFNELHNAFDKCLALGFINLYLNDPLFKDFNNMLLNNAIEYYTKLINEYNNTIVALVSAKAASKINQNGIDYVPSSKNGQLNKLIHNNGRKTTIRETIKNYNSIIKSYFPCFLMSPLSAAQYLTMDDENSLFDIVIFDESSQIPTHEAIGPIARGKSLIVAGDPEQLPPTTFFNTVIESDDDDIKYEDSDSLLDECLAIELPRIRLSYHYRSKHEELIQFSNHNFYKDDLHTFPSPSISEKVIEFKKVNLKENKKNSDISKEEVEAIRKAFLEIYMNPKTKDKSVGIIVFNTGQKDIVYDAINDLINDNSFLQEAINKVEESKKETWFVKSLENVQGDERDIIILSIGFKKSASGKANVNGPLTNANGKRRLNVAVSRSKEKMIVISTISYKDFYDDDRIKNEGMLTLKQFLQYAETISSLKPVDNEVDKKSLSYYIKKDLEENEYIINSKYSVVTNVGKSDFKVDVAIMDKKHNCILGILLDSKPINEISCRDKLYVQTSVLKSLNWKLVQVYTLQYFYDPKDTIASIINALTSDVEKISYNTEYKIEKDTTASFHYKSLPYKKPRTYKYLNYIDYNPDIGFLDIDIVNTLIKDIIQNESPISKNELSQIIRECCRLQTLSKKMKSWINKRLCSLSLTYTIDQDNIFYWNSNPIVKQFRTQIPLDIYDVPKEEIWCCMKQILDVQGEIDKEELFRITLEVMDYKTKTLTQKMIDRLNYVYYYFKK